MDVEAGETPGPRPVARLPGIGRRVALHAWLADPRLRTFVVTNGPPPPAREVLCLKQLNLAEENIEGSSPLDQSEVGPALLLFANDKAFLPLRSFSRTGSL